MDDREIIRRAQAGDRDAFGVLFDLYYPGVYRYLSERMGGAPEAEDLCQEVFLKVLGAIDEYPSSGALGFDEWLLRVARRLANEHRSREQHERRAARSGPLSGGYRGLNPAALALLHDTQRRVVDCRYQAGLSVRQTASVLGMDSVFVRRVERAALETWLEHAPPADVNDADDAARDG
jgi:RNA polymerase sigma-70 factor, ECF subfamily